MDYIVVESIYAYKLADEVNKKISEGYEVSGSMVVSVSGKRELFYQPMVKKNDSKMKNFLAQ